jgi:tripartite-type tricarboxylate transporter receptor subunit TctC
LRKRQGSAAIVILVFIFGGSYWRRDSMKHLLSVVLLLVLMSGTTEGQTVPFYQGKAIRLIVGTTPGGGYDRWARFFARYMPKYIPGNPDLIVQNMPGAAGMTAVNYVYRVVKPDGLTVAITPRNMAIDQLAGVKEVSYDVRKLNWIGTPAKGFQLLYVRADSPYKSIEDILKAQEPPKCGNTAADGGTYVLGKILEETLGAKLTIVSGYLGGNEADLRIATETRNISRQACPEQRRRDAKAAKV